MGEWGKWGEGRKGKGEGKGQQPGHQGPSGLVRSPFPGDVSASRAFLAVALLPAEVVDALLGRLARVDGADLDHGAPVVVREDHLLPQPVQHALQPAHTDSQRRQPAHTMWVRDGL